MKFPLYYPLVWRRFEEATTVFITLKMRSPANLNAE